MYQPCRGPGLGLSTQQTQPGLVPLSLQMALYFCSGMLQDQAQFRHYALNVPLYTHFTSPIRRFADVIVHRLLAAALGKGHDSGLGRHLLVKSYPLSE